MADLPVPRTGQVRAAYSIWMADTDTRRTPETTPPEYLAMVDEHAKMFDEWASHSEATKDL